MTFMFVMECGCAGTILPDDPFALKFAHTILSVVQALLGIASNAAFTAGWFSHSWGLRVWQSCC
jgi:hypothetical protein